MRHNERKMRYLDKLVLKSMLVQKMINTITYLMLKCPSTSDDDLMNNGVSKSTVLEPTINT